VPIDLMERDMPERYEIVFEREFDPLRLVGLFNFEDAARDLSLVLPPGRWHAFELWTERYTGAAEGSLTFEHVAPHGCRVVSLRPADGSAPCVVGSTAHIGGGVLDITDQTWDEAAGVLSVQLAPAGRRKRRIYVATSGRGVLSATLDGVPGTIVGAGAACFVDATVDAPTRLEIGFEGP
jgi:hypothetical protein